MPEDISTQPQQAAQTPAMSQPAAPDLSLPEAASAAKASFARQRPGVLTRDRAGMTIRVAVRADGSRSPAPAPDPAAVAEARRRFAICRTCEHARDDGFACDLYAGCCLGKFRTIATSHCPSSKW